MYTSKLPYVYQIEPTNACSYRCYMCPRGKGEMGRPAGIMSFDLLRCIRGHIPAYQRMLRLYHFGESVEDIWNGEKVQAMRELFIKKETFNLPLCNNCYLAPHNCPAALTNLRRGYSEEGYILNLYPPFRESSGERQ